MKKALKNEVIMMSILLVVILAIVLSCGAVTPIANAFESDELSVQEINTEEYAVKKYSNVSNYLRASKKSRSNSNSNSYAVFGLTEYEMTNLKDSVDRAKSIMVQETLLKVEVDDNGEVVSTLAMNPVTTSVSWDDIPNNKGKTGYMSARITIVQDPALDKFTYRDGKNYFTSYGFKVTANMTWKKTPAYRMTDVFAICGWDGGVYCEDAGNCKFTASYTFTASTGTSYSTSNINVSPYFTAGGWPSYKFNLPNNISSPQASTRYSNMQVNSTLVMYASDDFNVQIGYAHKEICVGNISVSFPKSISFTCGTSMRAYYTPGCHVDLVKDPEREAAKL